MTLPAFRGLAAAAMLWLFGHTANAQTYYYLDQITVTPSSPTTADAITITVSGSLSSTAAYIMNTSWMLMGNTVHLTVNAGFQGIGLDVLVPHTESFAIGNLPAGTYMINITGGSILDSAPPQEHEFVVVGGSPTACDSLEIISVSWPALNTEFIQVVAANGSADLFDHPGFVLLDANGDTLARETVVYFGIGVSPQMHSLTVVPGAEFGQGPVQGQLHLWSDFYADQACSWEGPFDLCPTQECTPITPYLMNLGDAIVNVEMDYSIENADGLEMISGTFQLTSEEQSDYAESVCLPVGTYTLHVEQVGAVGGQLFYGVQASTVYNTEMREAVYEQGGATNELDFALFAACMDGSNGLQPGTAEPGLGLSQDGDEVLLAAMDGKPIGAFWVLDAAGRLVRPGNILTERGRFSMAGTNAGVYVLRTSEHGSIRFIR